MNIGEEIKKKLKSEKSSVPNLAVLLDIPEDRIYKWTQGVAEPKNEDRIAIKKWLNSEIVPRETELNEPDAIYRERYYSEVEKSKLKDEIIKQLKNQLPDKDKNNLKAAK